METPTENKANEVKSKAKGNEIFHNLLDALKDVTIDANEILIPLPKEQNEPHVRLQNYLNFMWVSMNIAKELAENKEVQHILSAVEYFFKDLDVKELDVYRSILSKTIHVENKVEKKEVNKATK